MAMDGLTRNRLNTLLIGLKCGGVENRGNYLQLVLGSRRLIVGAAWRVVHDDDIIIGSASEEEVLEKLPHILIGQQIVGVTVSGAFNDLQLRFTQGILLEVFADSEKYEHWNVVGGPNEMIIAGPGRLWSSF